MSSNLFFQNTKTRGYKGLVFVALALAGVIALKPHSIFVAIVSGLSFVVFCISVRDIFIGGKFGVSVSKTYLSYTESNSWAYKSYDVLLDDIIELSIIYDSEGNSYQFKTADGRLHIPGNLEDQVCERLFKHLEEVCKNAKLVTLNEQHT